MQRGRIQIGVAVVLKVGPPCKIGSYADSALLAPLAAGTDDVLGAGFADPLLCGPRERLGNWDGIGLVDRCDCRIVLRGGIFGGLVDCPGFHGDARRSQARRVAVCSSSAAAGSRESTVDDRLNAR